MGHWDQTSQQGGGNLPKKGCVGFVSSIGGGLPKSKAPTLSLWKLEKMVSLSISMMKMTEVANLG